MMHFLRYSYAIQNNILTFNKLNTRLQENQRIYYGLIENTSFSLLGYQFRTSSLFNSAFDSYWFLKVF